MKPFIKACEIWAPQKNSMILEFIEGHYGELEDFREVSQNKTFGYDQGLPGKAWSNGKPIILSELKDSYFERIQAAAQSGITAAIAMPVFAGQCLAAVLVLLCGDSEEVTGAIELWHCDESANYDMNLVDGYFGTLDHFEFLSRHTSFRRGVGLPGVVWDSGMPKIFGDLGHSHRFIRTENAIEAGMTTGIGIPFFFENEHSYVMTFLSALGTPIAKQIELWLPSYDLSNALFLDGYTLTGVDLNAQYNGYAIAKGQGMIGRTLVTGMPEITSNAEQIAELIKDNIQESPITCMITFPVLEKGSCKCIVVFYY